MSIVVFLEAMQHYQLQRPGSVLHRSMYPIVLILMVLAIKVAVKRYRWLEDHAAFLLSSSLVISVAECSIFLSPDQLTIAPV